MPVCYFSVLVVILFNNIVVYRIQHWGDLIKLLCEQQDRSLCVCALFQRAKVDTAQQYNTLHHYICHLRNLMAELNRKWTQQHLKFLFDPRHRAPSLLNVHFRSAGHTLGWRAAVKVHPGVAHMPDWGRVAALGRLKRQKSNSSLKGFPGNWNKSVLSSNFQRQES